MQHSEEATYRQNPLVAFEKHPNIIPFIFNLYLIFLLLAFDVSSTGPPLRSSSFTFPMLYWLFSSYSQERKHTYPTRVMCRTSRFRLKRPL